MHILLPPSWRYEPSERKQREERREEKKKQTIVNTEQGFNKDLAAQADDGSISLDLIQLFLHLAMEYLGCINSAPDTPCVGLMISFLTASDFPLLHTAPVRSP